MRNSGFTKVEILIVAILALFVIGLDIFVIYYLNVKQSDIQVLSEVDQIRSGLEVFILNNNFYPSAATPVSLNDDYSGTEKLCLDGFKKINEQCQKNILNPVPKSASDNVYVYQSTEGNKNYKLEFFLKTNFKKLGLKKGQNCATNFQITSQPCF